MDVRKTITNCLPMNGPWSSRYCYIDCGFDELATCSFCRKLKRLIPPFPGISNQVEDMLFFLTSPTSIVFPRHQVLLMEEALRVCRGPNNNKNKTQTWLTKRTLTGSLLTAKLRSTLPIATSECDMVL